METIIEIPTGHTITLHLGYKTEVHFINSTNDVVGILTGNVVHITGVEGFAFKLVPHCPRFHEDEEN